MLPSNVDMNFMYVCIAVSISGILINSSLRCERDDSPGPIFMQSASILIQSEVVGEEKVSMPRASFYS